MNRSFASIDSLRESLALFLNMRPSNSPASWRTIEQAREDGFTRSLIRYEVAGGEPVDAFLFEPANLPSHGAVLALHQHNSQWAIGKSEIAGLVGDPLQAFGPALARRGVTVLAPDAIGFESRMKAAGWGTTLAPQLDRPHSNAEGWLQYYNQAAYRIVRGELLMTKLLEDCGVALEVLRSRANATRMGVIGHSFGGTVALFFAALNTRVAFACSSGALCSYRQKMASGTALEMSLVIPGFQNRFDLDDLLRCVVPRKILIVSSEGDPQTEDATELVTQARPAFDSQGCTFQLQHVRVPGGHPLDPYRSKLITDWTVTQATSA